MEKKHFFKSEEQNQARLGSAMAKKRSLNKQLFSLFGNALAALCLVATALLTSACAQDGFDDSETWESDVKNATLSSPTVDDITIAASTDGSKTVITWKVVYGAGGYYCSVYNVNDEDNPVAVDDYDDTLVDGCSVAVTRDEDTNYKFIIRTAGNEKLNNTEASASTEVAFNTFVDTYATIPSGTDLYEYFTNNPLPDEAEETELCFDLEPGGDYTLSDAYDFDMKKIILRTTSQSNHAKVTYTGETATLRTQTAFTLKYIDFDMSATSKALFELSKEKNENLLGATGTGSYYNIQEAIVINGCNIEGVCYRLIYDNGNKYCVEQMLIKNCFVHLTTVSDAPDNVIDMYGGFVNTMTIQNSTFYNTGDGSSKYFLRYSNDGRCDRAGYTKNTISYENCTLYNIVYSGQIGNYSGIAGKATSAWNMTNCIFVNCGSKAVPRRFIGGSVNSSSPPNFANNTYMYNDEFESTEGSVSPYDTSGTAIEEDPGFADPTNGDFTISGAAQIAKQTGDPRWLP